MKQKPNFTWNIEVWKEIIHTVNIACKSQKRNIQKRFVHICWAQFGNLVCCKKIEKLHTWRKKGFYIKYQSLERNCTYCDLQMKNPKKKHPKKDLYTYTEHNLEILCTRWKDKKALYMKQKKGFYIKYQNLERNRMYCELQMLNPKKNNPKKDLYAYAEHNLEILYTR